MQNIYIKTQLPALVAVNNIKKYLSNIQQTLCLRVGEGDNLLILYQPTAAETDGVKMLPYAADLNLKDINKNNIRQVQITSYPGGNIEVILKPNNIQTMPLPPQKVELGGKGFTVKLSGGDNGILEVYGDNNLLYQKYLNYEVKAFSTKTMGNNLLIECLLNNKKTCLIVLAFNGTFNEYFFDTIDSLDFKNNVLTAFKYLHDIAKQGKIYTFKFGKNGAEFKEKTVYTDNKPHLTTDSRIIPYAFLEAVKAQNFNLARHYMAGQLSARLTNEHLKQFFKGAVGIKQNLYVPGQPNAAALIFKNGQNYTAKLYNFEIDNDKINNITEL